MRNYLALGFALAWLTALAPNCACADDDSARLKEMLHRTQEALHQAQSENVDLARAKADAEHKLQDASQQLDSEKKNASKAAQVTRLSLKAQLAASKAAQENLQHELDTANGKVASSDAHSGELSHRLMQRDAQIKDLSHALMLSKTAIESCEEKNGLLYTYGREILQRYKNKGVWSALAQKEPVFGLKEVTMENVVQEYQLKMDQQKIQPAASADGP